MKAATLLEAFDGHVRIISIHAAREGGDAKIEGYADMTAISIHAAREGGDTHGESGASTNAYFNPRRP